MAIVENENIIEGLNGVIESQRITNEVLLRKLTESIILLSESIDYIPKDNELSNKIVDFINKM